MTKQNRQKLSILVVLLAVLGLTIVLGYRMNTPATTAAVQAAENKTTAANRPASSDGARIRLDLMEKPEDFEEGVGSKNLFVYRQAPPPPPPAFKPGAPGGGLTPVPVAPVPSVQQNPPGPPPPPPIQLRYEGFAVINSPEGELTAFLADPSRHYNVRIGEVLMGRYRITRISETSVEVEDLEYNRRQTLPLVK